MSDAIAEGGELTDGSLLAAASRGDRAAFERLVERHAAHVYRFARTLARGTDDAEDLLQQTFLAAWQAAGQFRGDTSARGWLFTITRHAASRVRTRRGREAIDDTPVDALGLQAGWGQSDPELAAMREERRLRLAAAFATLDGEDQAVLTLRDLEGCSGDETAALLGVSVAAMKSRLHRARLRLAAALRKEGCDVAR